MMDLKFQLIGYFLLSKTMMGMSTKESEEQLMLSVRTYAKGLRK